MIYSSPVSRLKSRHMDGCIGRSPYSHAPHARAVAKITVAACSTVRPSFSRADRMSEGRGLAAGDLTRRLRLGWLVIDAPRADRAGEGTVKVSIGEHLTKIALSAFGDEIGGDQRFACKITLTQSGPGVAWHDRVVQRAAVSVPVVFDRAQDVNILARARNEQCLAGWGFQKVIHLNLLAPDQPRRAVLITTSFHIVEVRSRVFFHKVEESKIVARRVSA